MGVIQSQPGSNNPTTSFYSPHLNFQNCIHSNLHYPLRIKSILSYNHHIPESQSQPRLWAKCVSPYGLPVHIFWCFLALVSEGGDLLHLQSPSSILKNCSYKSQSNCSMSWYLQISGHIFVVDEDVFSKSLQDIRTYANKNMITVHKARSFGG